MVASSLSKAEVHLTACPRKKIMKSEPLSSEYLHARHSSGSQSRDSSGPLDMQTWSGGEFSQTFFLLSPNLLKARHNVSRLLEILKHTIRLIGKIDKSYLDTMSRRVTCLLATSRTQTGPSQSLKSPTMGTPPRGLMEQVPLHPLV